MANSVVSCVCLSQAIGIIEIRVGLLSFTQGMDKLCPEDICCILPMSNGAFEVARLILMSLIDFGKIVPYFFGM